ncbi:transposase [Flavobacterium sp.]|uniref:transposase n=1 Tax=Flavobacterium sp. TaxID=239 RepID=UPI0039E6DBB3
MILEKGMLYHIYNQENNKQNIFFSKENYYFFLKKMKEHITPYADFIAWCLMPNHFHWMVEIKELELPVSLGFTLSEALTKVPNEALTKTRTLNDSIGILLRSYTRAINIQEKFSGSLFRKETKAICLNDNDILSPNYYNTEFGTEINLKSAEINYPNICFNYILQNPVKAGFVTKEEDWGFSSRSNLELINVDRLKELGMIYSGLH